MLEHTTSDNQLMKKWNWFAENLSSKFSNEIIE